MRAALYDPANNPVKSHGYGYMTMRDGTKLAYTTHPPTDVVNSLPLPSALADQKPPLSATDPARSTRRRHWSSTPATATRTGGPVSGIEALANLMGFTVVDVNMRGTGCSGGAFDFFEPLQSLDGYDVIETSPTSPGSPTARSGCSASPTAASASSSPAQTAAARPRRDRPLSVIEQTQTTLYPGGILNTGFAVAWAQERQDQAKPADPSDPGHGARPYADDGSGRATRPARPTRRSTPTPAT